jgi:hypothetical protein
VEQPGVLKTATEVISPKVKLISKDYTLLVKLKQSENQRWKQIASLGTP